jgi:hypothetical protein
MSPAAKRKRKSSKRKAPRLTRLGSVDDVIEALGGVQAVSRLTRGAIKSVYHWSAVREFPARHHDIMTRALGRRRYVAPAHLWNQTVARKAA